VGTYFGVNSSFYLVKDIYWIDEIKKIPLDVPVRQTKKVEKLFLNYSFLALWF
jgi:hypothetical protein